MVEKYKFTDAVNIRTAAETIFKATNTRIKERILTSSSYATDYQNATHVLSAEALYHLIGNLEGYETNDGTGTDVVSLIKALDLAIGETTDTSADETVYGAIAAVQERISALTHLTYQVVQTDDITTFIPMNEAKEDVIYLQRKNPSYSVARDGFLLSSSNTVAEAGEAGSEYAAYFNQGDGKYYKADKVDGAYVISETELDSEDPIFDSVATVADNTYTMYVCQLTKNSEDEVTGIQWIEVGNTDITLSDYVSKSDYDIREVQQRIMEPMSAQTIIDQVRAAFNATDPYGANAQTTSYLDSWLPASQSSDPEPDPDPEQQTEP